MDTNEQFNQQIENSATNNQFTPSAIPFHTHSGTDSPLVTNVSLPAGTPVKLGLGGILSTSNASVVASGSASEQIQTSIVAGKDQSGSVGITTDNLQLNLLHQPQNALNQSFINAYRPPLYGTIPNTTISVASGGNTLTTVGYGFTTNALAGANINIFNSSGALVETQTIASNTATVITITGTWINTTNSGSFLIYQPVFLGSADVPWQRFYTSEGTGAGVRFGVGTTAGGQNGLMYMDSVGDIYWRDKANTVTKLNGTPGSGTVTKVSVTTANGLKGTVANDTTTPAITLALNGFNGVLISTDISGEKISGATIPADATKFLNGSVTPTFAYVKDSDLAVTDITNNNVSASAHGFAPKFPNNTTTFLRGDGTYAAPTSASVAYSNGTATKASNDASTTQNIAHGLGVVPAKVRITAIPDVLTSTNGVCKSFTVYNGTVRSSMSMYGTAADGVMVTTFTISYVGASNGDQTGVVTFNATNIIITWTKTGSPNGGYVLLWEAEK